MSEAVENLMKTSKKKAAKRAKKLGEGKNRFPLLAEVSFR